MKFAALIALVAIAVTTAKDLTPVDHVRDAFYDLENELWKNVTDPGWRENGLGGDVELTKAFVVFNDQFEVLPAVPRPVFGSWLWNKAIQNLQVIDGLYKTFVGFVTRQATPGSVPAPVREWLDLAEAILMDPKLSVNASVTKLHNLMAHGDLFRTALQDQDSDICELQMSPHQLIYDMYNTIALTEIKGYAMMQFSWMLLRIYGKGNYTQEASLTRQRYSERTGQAATAARAALSMANRGLYRCDPPIHEEGVTYAQVTNLLQGYIANEVDLNSDGTCRENCGHYTLTKTHGCYEQLYCSKQRPCKGRIIGCNYIDSDMWVCPASSASSRRYEWIEYENGRTLGRAQGHCSRGTDKVDSWWRWLFWHCSYCMCLCDDSTNSDRYFSLWDATSDVKNNKSTPGGSGISFTARTACAFAKMRRATANASSACKKLMQMLIRAITGIRMVKHGKVFHLQIHQGTLGERGVVEPGEWVPVQKFDPSDYGINEDIDYHTLTYERRAIDLDELDSPSGHVLTGVRFRMIGPHLHFEIKSTPFNYTTGRLSPERSQWISNDNTDGAIDRPRRKLELYKPDVPTRTHMPFPVDSNHDQYVEFTHTDYDADAAQSTVPFIDIQPVLPTKGGSLSSGAGLIHRGGRGSGGFLAVKLITYDLSKHVKAEPPPQDFTEQDSTEFTPVIN